MGVYFLWRGTTFGRVFKGNERDNHRLLFVFDLFFYMFFIFGSGGLQFLDNHILFLLIYQ